MGSLALYGAMSASLGDPVAMAKVGVRAIAGQAAAKLITSPTFVRWLASPVPEAGGWIAHLSRLAAIRAAEPEIKDEIHQYIIALRGAPAAGAEVAGMRYGAALMIGCVVSHGKGS